MDWDFSLGMLKSSKGFVPTRNNYGSLCFYLSTKELLGVGNDTVALAKQVMKIIVNHRIFVKGSSQNLNFSSSTRDQHLLLWKIGYNTYFYTRNNQTFTQEINSVLAAKMYDSVLDLFPLMKEILERVGKHFNLGTQERYDGFDREFKNTGNNTFLYVYESEPNTYGELVRFLKYLDTNGDQKDMWLSNSWSWQFSKKK